MKEYHEGTETRDKRDPFPELELLPKLNRYKGFYLARDKGLVFRVMK